MLLFPKEEHDNIKAGFITVTFRDWDKLRVEAGKEYKSFNLGYVRVEEIGYVDFKKVSEEDLEAAGFNDPDDFKKVFRKRNPGFNFGSGKLIRIKYRFLGEENRSASRVKPNDQELIRIMERLIEIDVMSDAELKCDDILKSLDREIPKNSNAISAEFEIERDEIRKRMTLLKKEGLVSARRNGFVLSIRGKSYLGSKV